MGLTDGVAQAAPFRFSFLFNLPAIGGEWEVYGFRVRGTHMTLSGGDLTDPVTFDRTGPASPRPATVAVPPDPKKRAL